MKRKGLLNKHFCKQKIPNIPTETEKIVNFHFSHHKSMEILVAIVNRVLIQPKQKTQNFCRDKCNKHVCKVSASSTLWFLRRRFFNIFF